MARERYEFAKILEGILKSDSGAKSATEAVLQKHDQFNARLNQSQIWWHTPAAPTRPIKTATAYPRPHLVSPVANTKIPAPPLVKPIRPERSIQLSQLPRTVKQAAEQIYNRAGLPLPEALKEYEFRQIYRRLARRLHPDSQIGLVGRDVNALAADFRELKTNYDLVRREFKKNSPST
ncbi:MAG: hypothetical protein AB7N80_10945 [Bdellovibrionales bacterium]